MIDAFGTVEIGTSRFASCSAFAAARTNAVSASRSLCCFAVRINAANNAGRDSRFIGKACASSCTKSMLVASGVAGMRCAFAAVFTFAFGSPVSTPLLSTAYQCGASTPNAVE